ncbi:MAG: hypothetical protein MI723_04820, partial [Caulobacterales bacterium]|nr:hypothetical protein [Caulobacterales bacterium]
MLGHTRTAAAAAIAAALATAGPIGAAAQQGVLAVALDGDDIGGVVTSANGPEAGVWVIAETGAFDTFFAKIVVTDEEGRYVLPDLPLVEYEVWVRGYGLADSEPVAASPGDRADLTAVLAPDAAVAAEAYPAAYWYAMMRLPSGRELAAVPDGLNGYLTWIKSMGCVGCHQMGQLSTRTFPPGLGRHASSQEAWTRRLQAGQAGGRMMRLAGQRLGGAAIAYLADWTDRIAAGELPHARPDRPSGLERHMVATVRDWADEKSYLHDLSGTDRRDPTVNGDGPLYGAPELSTDYFPILDPIANAATTFHAPVRDPDPPGSDDTPPLSPSPYWGEEAIWTSRANAHNPMLDEHGRVWYTARVRSPDNPPAFCGEGSDHPSAQLFPNTRSSRHLALFDPVTEDYEFIDTCFGTHHLQFAEDENDTLWTSGGRDVVGWLNTRLYDETGDAAAAQGRPPPILDTNANGRGDPW